MHFVVTGTAKTQYDTNCTVFIFHFLLGTHFTNTLYLQLAAEKDRKEKELWAAFPFAFLGRHFQDECLAGTGKSQSTEYSRAPQVLHVSSNTVAFFLHWKQVLVQMESVALKSCQHPH